MLIPFRATEVTSKRLEAYNPSKVPPGSPKGNFSPTSFQPTMAFHPSMGALYQSSSGPGLLKPTVASIKTHTMGSFLIKYLRMKVHPDIQNKEWARIVVKGIHERNPSKACLSPTKKRDKSFNWSAQRPP